MKAAVSALDFSRAGKKYLGRPYDEMDCQAFYEKCAEDCGLVMDLKGSNAWYRKFRETGWTGTPEECKTRFGSIPKGATLFIHAFDHGEEKRGYHDGLGNASHIGIKTGTGKGAIHSSSKKKKVAESEFHDKTIRNGGWNMVGLSRLFDYGAQINRILEGEAVTEDPADNPAEDKQMKQKATVWSMNGGPVKMRQLPSDGCGLYEQIPFGTEVDVVQRGETWTKITAAGRTGWWIKTAFLVFGEVVPGDDTQEDPMDPGDGFPGDDESGNVITIQITREQAQGILEALEFISEKITAQVGRR